ncbi:MAG: histidine phosphatase family protein [Defluviitaleaceae bacterium]|nr:histidine phosphatase family protein [Defluviitaleaceae bacterium]
MTTIYFVRHATPDRSVGEDATFPLTEKGQKDVALVTKFLQDKNIDVILSSPFKRSHDTVADFAKEANLPVEIINDFRERAVSHEWIEDFTSFAKQQFGDFSYKLPGGECLSEVQERNIAALEDVLTRYGGKSIAVGTHGTALSTIILKYHPAYTFEEWQVMPMPWVVKMIFSGKTFVSLEKIDLFVK